MIVRITGHGSFEVDQSFTDLLNELSGDAAAAVDAGDEGSLRERLEDLTCLVVATGDPVSVLPTRTADIVIPPVGASLDEARLLLCGAPQFTRVSAAA